MDKFEVLEDKNSKKTAAAPCLDGDQFCVGYYESLADGDLRPIIFENFNEEDEE